MGGRYRTFLPWWVEEGRRSDGEGCMGTVWYFPCCEMPAALLLVRSDLVSGNEGVVLEREDIDGECSRFYE